MSAPEHRVNYDWRARIGLIYPACGKRDNDFSRLVPDGVSVHVTRVAFSGRVTAEDIGAMAELENLLAAARLLKDVQPSCVSHQRGNRRPGVDDHDGRPRGLRSTRRGEAGHRLPVRRRSQRPAPIVFERARPGRVQHEKP